MSARHFADFYLGGVTYLMPMEPVIPYHLAQLRALCTKHPVETKVVFVPTRLVGLSVGAALVRAGVQWANLHLTTVRDWAEREVGPSLAAEGRHALGSDAALVRIQEIVRSIEDRPAAPVNALARAAYRTMGALRMAGMTGTHLASLKGTTEITRFAATVCTEYEQWLEAEKLYDSALLLGTAIARAGLAGGAIVGIFDEVRLTGREREYVDRLSGGRLLTIGAGPFGLDAPALSAAGLFGSQAATSGAIGRGIRLWLEDERETAGELVAREVFSPALEVQEVIRTLQSRGIPLGDAELVYTTESPYLHAAWALCDRYGLPATFAGGVPVLRTRPGIALQGWLEWIESDFDGARLVNLLASRAIRLSGAPSVHEAASLIRKAKIGRGKRRYQEVLSQIAQAEPALGEDAPYWNGRQRYVASWLLGHLDQFFEMAPSGSTVRLQKLAQGCIQYLDAFTVCHPGTPDEEARESIARRLRDLAARAGERWPLDEAVRHVKSILSLHRVGASAPANGKLHVAPLEAGGYSGRPFVFVVGLDQRSFPGGTSEDPLLLDSDRGRLGLPALRSGAGERNWDLVRLLAMQQGTVYLSTARFDDAGEQRTYASAAFLQAGRLATRVEPVPVSMMPLDENELLPVRALTDAEIALCLRQAPGIRTDLLQLYPGVQAGLEALQAREGSEWTCYEGLLETGLDLTETIFSASALEDLATCAFKYFLKRILRAAPVEELQDEEDADWLGAMGSGSLLHRVFRSFLEELERRGEKPDLVRHEDELMRLVDEAVALERSRSALPNQAAFDREVRKIRKSAHIFLATESEYLKDVRPIGFEVGFGFPDSPAPGQSDPVTLDLGAVTIKLRGRIDRIDEHSDGSLGIWDYKTGGASTYGEDLLQAHKLQWALYALAVQQMTDRPVTVSGYLFTSEKEWGRRISQPLPDPSEIGAVLEPAFAAAREGIFRQRLDNGSCKYCDYRAVCGDIRQRKIQVENKVARRAEGITE